MGHYEDELRDIAIKGKIVQLKRGQSPFYEGFDGFHFFDLYDGLSDITVSDGMNLDDEGDIL